MSELTPLLRRFCDYSITFKNNTPASIVNMRSLLKRFIEFTPTHTTMDLTKRVVKEWIFYGREQWDWSPKTIRNQLQAISSFCSWLVEEEIMPENPAKDIRRPKLKKALPRTLSKDDALTVLEWSQHYPSRNRLERTRAPAIIGIFLFTGLRKSELLNLKLEDVRLDEGELFVREGKGQKDRLVPMSQRLHIFSGSTRRSGTAETEHAHISSPACSGIFACPKWPSSAWSSSSVKRARYISTPISFGIRSPP